ncbi:sensor histidine kinase [Actinophytocola sp.]|uniref:sensor histidine kinase n=1 Tax=Actinophytocola sp. TaxID=1872138 RepID=UPI003D6AFB5B
MSATREQGSEWSRWRRPRPTPAQRRRDVWLGLAVVGGSALVTVLVNSMGAFAFGDAPSLGEQFGWTAAMAAPLVVRTRFPVAVLCTIGALFIAGQVRHVGDNLMPSIALFLAIYTVGAWERNRPLARWARIGVIATMFGWLGISLVRALFSPPHAFEDAAGPLDPLVAAVIYQIGINVLFFLSAYFFGNAAWLSARRQAELVAQAEELRRSQEQNTRGAVVAERVRIARDLHDVVAHHVSVMGVQAGAARRVLDKDGDAAREALRAVEDTARVAIGELRGLLGVLRAEPDTGATPPDEEAAGQYPSSPGLAELSELVSTTRAAGLEVDLGVYGQARPVPDGVALSAYRVAQEALTNVVRHAGARKADVRVRYLAGTLEVEVTDDGRERQPDGGANRGFGLLGMRERVAVHGGELEAGPRRDGGYRVRAVLPTGGSERSTSDTAASTAPSTASDTVAGAEMSAS